MKQQHYSRQGPRAARAAGKVAGQFTGVQWHFLHRLEGCADWTRTGMCGNS